MGGIGQPWSSLRRPPGSATGLCNVLGELRPASNTALLWQVQEDGASCSTLIRRDTETRMDSSAQGGRHAQEFATTAPTRLSWMGPIAVGRVGPC